MNKEDEEWGMRGIRTNGINRFKHRLIVRIVPHEIIPHFFKGTIQLTGNLPPHHGPAFPNGGCGFGVWPQFSSLGVAVFGAQRAVALDVKAITGIVKLLIRSRSKRKNNFPRRYFRRYVNGQPVAVRYVYGLRNGHKANIA